jgi:hypothetical protein
MTYLHILLVCGELLGLFLLWLRFFGRTQQ